MPNTIKGLFNQIFALENKLFQVHDSTLGGLLGFLIGLSQGPLIVKTTVTSLQDLGKNQTLVYIVGGCFVSNEAF